MSTSIDKERSTHDNLNSQMKKLKKNLIQPAIKVKAEPEDDILGGSKEAFMILIQDY